VLAGPGRVKMDGGRLDVEIGQAGPQPQEQEAAS